MSNPAAPILLNGEPLPLSGPPPQTLSELLERLGIEPQRVATALNGHFIPRDARATCPLQPGDHITTFAPIVGG